MKKLVPSKCFDHESVHRNNYPYGQINQLTFYTGSDDDKIILMAFEAFEINGQIDTEM